MELLDRLRDPVLGRKLAALVVEKAVRVAERLGRPPVFMEVCGTHTTAISRLGLRSLLGGVLELRSGPGCPVCVTSAGDLDRVLALARLPGVTVATYGDMVRVPGSLSSLEKEKARGARVQVVYSPVQAVELARAATDQEVIFIGVGFETTAPLVALSIAEARQSGVENFSVLSLHKLVPPALGMLLHDSELNIDGMLLPGHVCAVTGCKTFDFIALDFSLPAVVAGFEALDILGAVYRLLEMLESGMPTVVNDYARVVRDEGNPRAFELMQTTFAVGPANWRGFSAIPASGLYLRPEYNDYDAEKKFPGQAVENGASAHERTGCRCSDLLKGRLTPPQCPLFGKVCTPSRPVGPCMVSSEGACAAYYQYEKRPG